MHVDQAVVLVGDAAPRHGRNPAQPEPASLRDETGRRLLDLLLFDLARHGFTDIILLPERPDDPLAESFGGRAILESTIRVMRDGGAFAGSGVPRLASVDLAPWFLLANSQSLFDLNYRDLAALPASSFDARLALREAANAEGLSAVALDGDWIAGFQAAPSQNRGLAIVDGGVGLMRRDMLRQMNGANSLEFDLFPSLAASRRLQGRLYEGRFLDLRRTSNADVARRELADRGTRPCVFLDRDGVLNHDGGYIFRIEDLHWIDGAREAVRRLNDAGWLVVVVSNQSGVARGLYTEADVRAFHAEMSRQLAEAGAHIDAFYFCPFHSDATMEAYRVSDHPDRKPNPGMILKAFAQLPIDRERSLLIGDKESDMTAASAAGVPGRLFGGGNLDAFVIDCLRGA